MAFITGKLGQVTINATEYCISEWACAGSVPMEDVTNSCSDGVEEVIPGIGSITGSFKVVYNNSSEPWPALYPGVSVSNIILKFDASNALGTIATAYITEMGVVTAIKGKIEITVNFQATAVAMTTVFA